MKTKTLRTVIMKRPRQLLLLIFLLLLSQVIILGIYINGIKDSNPNTILQGFKNNKKIDLNKHIEMIENDFGPDHTKWKLEKVKSTKEVKQLNRNVQMASQWRHWEREVFKSTQFIPSFKVKAQSKIQYTDNRQTKKISSKNLTKLISKLLSTNKKQTKQPTTQKSFTTQEPIMQAPKKEQPSTLEPLLNPAMSPSRNANQSIVVSFTKKPRNTYKTVLLYTSYFGKVPWPYPWFKQGMFFRENDGTICPHKCRITYKQSMMKHSDAVVFHANDIGESLMETARHGRKSHQRWIYLSLENPHNSAHSPTYDGMFNWTSTYMRDSEVYMPYNNYKRIAPNEIPKDPFTRNYAEGKSKLVAWAVAHCGTTRDEIVKKLLKYVNVTIFGGCSSRFNQNNHNRCPRGSDECRKTFRTYKFYLSFENSLCSDYVTEKYWETPLENEMVPVVFGANYDAKNSIPGSYINVLDFPSVESLAKYLKYLDKNDTAYNEYFRWKSQYKVQNHSWRCVLCANLYNDTLPRKVIHHFEQFWSPGARCSDSELQAKVNTFLAT